MHTSPQYLQALHSFGWEEGIRKTVQNPYIYFLERFQAALKASVTCVMRKRIRNTKSGIWAVKLFYIFIGSSRHFVLLCIPDGKLITLTASPILKAQLI